MKPGDSFNPKALVVPGVVMATFWTLAVTLTLSTGNTFWLLNFGYLGTAVGVGMGLFAALPRRHKAIGRKLSKIMVGAYMLGYLGLFMHENMQLEGFFFYLLSGFFSGAVLHYFVAKVFGPLLWGRGWCGWACWISSVLDLLPYPTSPGRVNGRWGWLRYAMFAASLLLVTGLWFVFDYRVSGHSMTALWWLVGGNLLYYSAGIGLAFVLKDNRAFCKYLCPIAVPLKLGTTLALMKVRGDAARCTSCAACTRACPMDVDIPAYVKAGTRVLSTECSGCLTCVHACPTRVLSQSLGFDLGGVEKLRMRQATAAVSTTGREPATRRAA